MNVFDCSLETWLRAFSMAFNFAGRSNVDNCLTYCVGIIMTTHVCNYWVGVRPNKIVCEIFLGRINF